MSVSFLITTLFLDYSGRSDLHPWLTFACDTLVFMAVLRWHKESWELGVAIAFLASVFASLLRIWNIVQVDWVYASMLELTNLGALLCISGTGLVDTIGRRANSILSDSRAVLRSTRNSL